MVEHAEESGHLFVSKGGTEVGHGLEEFLLVNGTGVVGIKEFEGVCGDLLGVLSSLLLTLDLDGLEDVINNLFGE